jgi:hypothetical protein
MAKLTGGGFTNLPPDRKSLTAKLERSAAAFARADGPVIDEQFVLILENTATGDVRGTCQLFTQVGQHHPFYSYRLGTLTQHSKELGRTFRADMLGLTTDLEGCSEVGGLFLHPGERAGGLGMLLARSRYLFIAAHRARFADRVLAAPGGGDYGPLAVMLGLFADRTRLLSLPPGAFRPAPRVHSSVVRLAFRPPPVPVARFDAVDRLVRTAFQQRRKTLANALRPLLDRAIGQAPVEGAPSPLRTAAELATVLAGAGIDPMRRPETLTPTEFVRLADTLIPLSVL